MEKTNNITVLLDTIFKIINNKSSIKIDKLSKELSKYNFYISSDILENVLINNKKYIKFKYNKKNKSIVPIKKESFILNINPKNDLSTTFKDNISIPYIVIKNIFDDINKEQIKKIQNKLSYLVSIKTIDNIYEKLWEQMLIYGTSSIKHGGLELRINNDNLKKYYIPSPNWIPIKISNIDKEIKILNYNYGYATIKNVNNHSVFLQYEKLSLPSKYDINFLEKDIFRMDIKYVKKDILNNPNYKPAYLKDIGKYQLYHKEYGDILLSRSTNTKLYFIVKKNKLNFNVTKEYFLTSNYFYQSLKKKSLIDRFFFK
jgi:hypothetical protein